MIKTYGLTHLNLEVADPERSLRFYEQMFGVREYFRDENSIQVLGPGEKDVIAFVRSSKAGTVGGISHFGFRLMAPEDIVEAIETAKSIGAHLAKRRIRARIFLSLRRRPGQLGN